MRLARLLAKIAMLMVMAYFAWQSGTVPALIVTGVFIIYALWPDGDPPA